MRTVTQSQAMVADRVTKLFGAARVVDLASFEVGRGEVVGIAGPNGAGKSTLGRILAGFLRPDDGSVKICGLDAAEHRRQNGVGFMPEETGRDWGSVRLREVLALCAPRGMHVQHDAIVARLQLTPILEKRVVDVSKGQWRSALAAAALIRRPAFLLLDEPDAGLDPLALVCLSDAMRLAASDGSSIVMLSHHLDAMGRVADRILFMRAGRMIKSIARGTNGFPSLHDQYAAAMREAS
jgi:ABC-type multidrug transport system ATPase subunit